MRITIVGGVERNEGAYRQVAEAAGHVLSFHSGHVGGRGSESLEQMVRHSDWLLVVTDVNSHGAVQLARRLGRKEGVPIALLRRLSPSRLAALISDRPAALAA